MHPDFLDECVGCSMEARRRLHEENEQLREVLHAARSLMDLKDHLTVASGWEGRAGSRWLRLEEALKLNDVVDEPLPER
jgi:hypothetical protein